MAQVYVGLENGVLEKIVKDLSSKHGLNTFHFADIKSAQPDDIIFVDNFYIDKIAGSFDHVVLLSDKDFEESFKKSIKYSSVSLIQAIDSHNFQWDIDKMIHQITGSQLLTLKEYLKLGDESEILNIEMKSFSEANEYIEKSVEFLKIDEYRNLIDRFSQIANEIIMNSFYDSQRDDSGEQMHFNQSRSSPIEVPKNLLPILTVAQNNDFIGFSVKDKFGTLRFKDLEKSLSYCVSQEKDKGISLREEGAGAGIGLYMSCSTSSKIVFNVKPGEYTEVICLLYKTRRYYEAAGTAPSFAYFERETAG